MGESKGRVRRMPAATVERFLAELAESCNVRKAAAAAGVDNSNLYQRRKADPAFARRWQEAMDEGAVKLEARVMAHAMGQRDPDADFDPVLAMKVLAQRDARMRRMGIGPKIMLMPIDKLEKLLLRRLDALARRMEKAA